MKRLITICSFLLVAVLVCVFYFVTLTSYNDIISSNIDTLTKSIIEEQGLSSAYETLDDSLNKFYSISTVFLNKTRLTDIKVSHAKIKILIDQDDTPSLLSEAATLRSYINSLYEIERPVLQNIL